MAPGGIEPPHADSKSAALSTELRGLGVRVDEARRSLCTGGGEKVVDENSGHRVASLRCCTADVRCEDDVWEVQQLPRNSGLVREKVERCLDPDGDELANQGVRIDGLSSGRVERDGAVATK